MTLYSIKNLTLSYPAGLEVLSGISLDIGQGEIILIAGRSGSGKSSLAYCMAGLIPVAIPGKINGNISLLGKEILTYNPWEICKHCGIVFQEPETHFLTFKVEDEVAFGPENLFSSQKEILHSVDVSLEYMDMKGFKRHPISSLSYGQKQKLALAATLALRPKCIIMDEPMSNLDIDSVKRLTNLCAALKKQFQTTVILIEHRLHWLKDIIDRVFVLDDGKIVYSGNASCLKNETWLKDMGLRGVFQKRETSSKKNLHRIETPMNLQFTKVDENTQKGFTRGRNEASILYARDIFFGFNGRLIFNGLNLKLGSGEILGVCGPNGSGKTTLLRIIAGLLMPQKGVILINTRPLHSIPFPERSRILGFVGQNCDHQLFMSDVSSELLPPWLDDMDMETMRSPDDMLRLFGLDGLGSRHPQSLSAGQKQRLAIAASLMKNPRILLMDEPTTGLDNNNIEKLLDIFLDLKSKGSSICVATHDQQIINEICDHRIVLD
ncbi:ABC transporter ATP-binding protein [bacterium]|nr:ABC transporter ATP-binding protein [bacterium]